MTVNQYRHWKCDRCGDERDTSPTNQPPMWGAVKWIGGGVPEAADDHAHWSRWHLCRRCIDSFMLWLRTPEPDEDEAELEAVAP